VIEHGASVDGVILSGEKRKYTFERDASGCLEHDQLIATKPSLEQRPESRSVWRCQQTVFEPPRIRGKDRYEVPHGGQEVGL
jgi:hypothetical protein